MKNVVLLLTLCGFSASAVSDEVFDQTQLARFMSLDLLNAHCVLLGKYDGSLSETTEEYKRYLANLVVVQTRLKQQMQQLIAFKKANGEDSQGVAPLISALSVDASLKNVAGRYKQGDAAAVQQGLRQLLNTKGPSKLPSELANCNDVMQYTQMIIKENK